MSSANSEFEKSYVITYKELLFTFVVFSAILFILFPKDLLKEQIKSEKSSYDLSMLYLKNLLIHSPDDETLQLLLATQSLRSGQTDLTLSLLTTLVKSKDKAIRRDATLLKYTLEKKEYFTLKNVEEKKRLRKKLRRLFLQIYREKFYNPKAVDKWYKEALFVSVDDAAFYFLEKKIDKRSKNIKDIESAYYYARKLNYPVKAMYYLQMLQKYDLMHRDKWINVEYFQYISYKQYSKAEKLLLHYANISLPWKKKLAEFYTMRQEFTKASNIYMQLFNDARVYKKKRGYFYKAVKVLQAGSLFSLATSLAHQYENYYIDDIDVRNFILKVYIASGKLQYASRFSKRIMRRGLR